MNPMIDLRGTAISAVKVLTVGPIYTAYGQVIEAGREVLKRDPYPAFDVLLEHGQAHHCRGTSEEGLTAARARFIGNLNNALKGG